MSNHLSKGTALITGASVGIGATYADRLAGRGYDLILVARNKDQLDALAAKLSAETGVKAEALQADLSKKSDLAKVEQRLRRDGKITMLVNNAGISVNGPLDGVDLDKLETLIALNITAVTRLAGAAIPGFIARKNGALINLASVLAVAPEISGGAYSGSKAYVVNFTHSLAQELKTANVEGVQIQVVLPGATRTEIWERADMDITKIPASMIMEVDEMVDAALAGFDLGELVTIPALPDAADWEAYETARRALLPNLSKDKAAARYKAA
jgi:short-subunit dehydrogenase